MSAAATPTQTDPNPASTDKPSRVARLLAIVRKLVDYGKELAANVRHRAQTEPYFGSTRFGTNDIARILASITRGLHRARELEERVLRNAVRLDAERKPARTRQARKPRPVAPAAAEAEPADPRLARLPTPDQIAAEVRLRPLGAVIADICYDLGIMPADPLWVEIKLTVMREGGNLFRWWRATMDRSFWIFGQPWPPDVLDGSQGPSLHDPAPTATGPP